jgi:hypothetical protein
MLNAKTSQIYAHYAPSAHEVAMVNAAFSSEKGAGSNSESKLSETQDTSEASRALRLSA